MKKLLLFLLLLVAHPWCAQEEMPYGGPPQYEHILSWSSLIDIDKEAAVTVTEDIKVFAAGENIRRGIFRTLPRWRNLNGKKQRISYDVISVKKDGQKEPYHIETRDADLIIYIGAKNLILSPGEYRYEIVYRTKNQIGFFKGYDEFYWNVTGTQWDFAIDSATAKVRFPDGAEVIQKACYTGRYGTAENNCTAEEISPRELQWSAANLQPNEGLTVAAGIKQGIFLPPPPPGFLQLYGITLLLIAGFLSLLIYFFSTWNKYGRDPQKPVVFPQFSAPQNLSPASAGYIQKEHFSDQLITASLVNLAVKGFLKIIEKEEKLLGLFGSKKYTLEKLKDSNESLPSEEQRLMQKLFSGGSTSISFDGKYNSKIETAVNDFKANLAYQHNRFLRKGDNLKLLIFPVLLIIGLYALALFVGFRLNFEKGFVTIGAVLGIVAGFLVLLSVAFSRFKFLPWLVSVLLFLATVPVVNYAVGDAGRDFNLNFYAAYVFILLSSGAFALYQFLIKQPTPEKLETQSLIEGFKMYLGTAEEKLLQFHNPPKMTPEIFEKLLPFAMVFGVDKIWGDKFKNVLSQTAVGGESQNYTSAWFVGSSLHNMNFAHTLNNSLSQSIASSAVQPSSSGSGSGGGGFSGGGGGGGGGGGW